MPAAPPELAAALRRRINGREVFAELTVARQRQAVSYVLGVRSPEACARRAETLADHILEAAAKRRRTKEA